MLCYVIYTINIVLCYINDKYGISLSTNSPDYEFSWVRVLLSTSSPGYKLS